MIPKLKNILKLKFRNGFIKYLKSLDFEEFKSLYVSYIKILIRYENIYLTPNAITFSKKWFINKIINIKNYNFQNIFIESNSVYVNKITSDMDKSNKFKEQVLNDFNETKKIFDNLSKHVLTFTENPTNDDIIKINVMMIDSIYLNNKLQKLSDEIDNFKK